MRAFRACLLHCCTAECYQQTPLKFATPETEIRYQDGSMPPFNVTSPTTNVGTWPAGSMWRKNPVPMCNCDVGFPCHNGDEDFHETMTVGAEGKACTAITPAQCSDAASGSCLKCGTANQYDCEQCCEGYILQNTTYEGQTYSWCKSSAPGPAPGPKPANPMSVPYKSSHFRPGQTNKLCPTGVQFPTLWDGGAGAGIPLGALGTFAFTMVDRLQVPDVPPGEYSVSWRW